MNTNIQKDGYKEMNDILKPAAHRLTLDSREHLTVSGVDDVISFDECGVVLKTVMGILSVDGAELRITNLNVDSKDVEIAGKINGIIYQGAQATRSSLFKKR